tara:strand:- start:37 stop:300 length:264 start_codon:yes stop_codon:yes gene_type:complete
MKLQEIIDVIQKRHTNTSGNQITRLANRAMQDFCQKTEIYEESFSLTTTADLRWQDIPDRAIKIKYIDVDGEEAPMVVGEPNKRDNT